MALVELAHKMPEERWVPLSEIAHSGNISLSYLEQLFAGLRKNGLVRSYRGPGVQDPRGYSDPDCHRGDPGRSDDYG